jgi:hypothetical protein
MTGMFLPRHFLDMMSVNSRRVPSDARALASSCLRGGHRHDPSILRCMISMAVEEQHEVPR